MHGVGAAYPAAVWPVRFSGTHALDKDGASLLLSGKGPWPGKRWSRARCVITRGSLPCRYSSGWYSSPPVAIMATPCSKPAVVPSFVRRAWISRKLPTNPFCYGFKRRGCIYVNIRQAFPTLRSKSFRWLLGKQTPLFRCDKETGSLPPHVKSLFPPDEPSYPWMAGPGWPPR